MDFGPIQVTTDKTRTVPLPPLVGAIAVLSGLAVLVIAGKKHGSALPCFLTGRGVGLALAGLWAPRSGAATRRLIGRKAEKGKDLWRAQAT